MIELVFLLEEASIAELLGVIVPDLLPSEIRCLFIPHEGKSDLEKSIPRKLRAWKTPGVQFVVVRDKDQGGCVATRRDFVHFAKKESGQTR